MIDELFEFALKGKLIRGTLFILVSEGLGLKINKQLLSIAAAIEIMHSSLLIQDDIIDKDKLRRGSKTVYYHYEEDGKKIGAYEPYHYGISTAIIVADIAFFFAMDLLTEFDSPHLRALMKYYSHEVYLVAVAESVDSIFGQTNREPTREEILDVYKYKTARYTFSLPFEMASIVAEAKDSVRKRLNKIGEQAGIIFQLKDDEIGLFGNEELIGKPVGSDIRENKKTLIRYLLYKNADQIDRKILDSSFGNPNSGNFETKQIRRLYEKYKIKKTIDEEISRIMERVWKDFKDLKMAPEQKNILKELLEFNTQRKA